MTNSSLTPDEARAALAEVDRRQHSAVDAAYDTPAAYFPALGGMLLALGGLYASNEWVEEQFGFAASVVAFVAGIALFAACLALLAGWTLRQQRATPSGKRLNANRDTVVIMIGAAVLLAAIFGIAFTTVDNNKDAVSLSLVLLAVVIAAGGRPLQALVRRRAHRRIERRATR
ncbi:hypothetical protein AB0I28_22400 [Phytomonospora sp. NPDC050363]|uniref:hypothetical protein n=1 Tax=Phytomonospora sp. NPDC050363 TaxID=3155642 RepID=UPI0033D1968E